MLPLLLCNSDPIYYWLWWGMWCAVCIWQFAGEICFIKVPENLKQSLVVFVLCLWSDQRVSVKLSSCAIAEEWRHSREWPNKTPAANRTLLHLYTIFHWWKARPSAVQFPCWFCYAVGSDQLEVQQMERAVWYYVIQPGFRKTQSSRVWKILISPGEQKTFVRFVG